MTSLLQAINEAPDTIVRTVADAAARPVAPAASDEALRLALHLRGTGTTAGGRALLFVPASSGAAASHVADEAARGLLALHEGAVLVMDLRAGAPASRPAEPGPGRPSTAAPFAGRTDAVRYAASAEFAGKLGEARARYSYILCIGAPLDTSVETLVTASLCDGVILAVAPHRTTRADLQRATGELRRRHANVLGFVLDAREAEKGA